MELYITFNDNGTGEHADYLFGGGITNFTWSLINNNADLKIVNSAGEDGIIRLENLTKSDVTFKNADTVGGITHISWSYYKKQ